MTKIDEQTLKDAVARGIPRAGGYVPPKHDTPLANDDDDYEEEIEEQLPKRRKGNKAMNEYRDKYFVRSEQQGRQLIYVSEEIHESLSEVVKVVGGKRATLSSYVENILRTHLTENKELLNGDHKRRYKCPIGW